MGKECVPQVSALCWRAHTKTLHMDRSGNPVGREDSTLKVLPSVASWMKFDELTFIMSPVWVPIWMGESGKGQEQISWLCKECGGLKTVMLLCSWVLWSRGDWALLHNHLELCLRSYPLTFLHIATQLQTGDNSQFSPFQW